MHSEYICVGMMMASLLCVSRSSSHEHESEKFGVRIGEV